LKKELCFSVVGKQQILDVQAQSKEMAELWVKGLRKLVGHSDEKSDKLAKQGLDSGNLPGHNRNRDVSENKRTEREHKKRTKSLMLLQQDLFVMTTTTVFRNLEEERIWDIDQGVRERFNAKALYELALREDIPWRQWNHWVREKIVTYLRENNRIATNQGYAPQQQMYGGHPQQQTYGGHPQQMYGGHPQQPMYGQAGAYYGSPQQQQHMQRQSQYGQQMQQHMSSPQIPQNVNMPQQQVPEWSGPPPQVNQVGGAPQGQGQGQGKDGQTDENCSLM